MALPVMLVAKNSSKEAEANERTRRNSREKTIISVGSAHRQAQGSTPKTLP